MVHPIIFGAGVMVAHQLVAGSTSRGRFTSSPLSRSLCGSTKSGDEDSEVPEAGEDEVELEYRAWSERFEEARRQKELVEWEHIAAGEDGEVTVRQVRSTAPKGLFYKEETFTGLPKAEK